MQKRFPAALKALLPPTESRGLPYPAIQQRERSGVAVLKVLKPPSQAGIELREDARERLPVHAARMPAQRILELSQALLAWPLHAAFEVIPEKVEAATLRGIHDARLFRMRLGPAVAVQACTSPAPSGHALAAAIGDSLQKKALRIRTKRLELIAATLELMKIEINSVQQLAAALDCAVPASWPPPLNDENSQRWFLGIFERDPAAVGWATWYVVLAVPEQPPQLIGNGGFKGTPIDNACEIGYSMLREHQGRGYATEAARAWVSWAFQHRSVEHVRAETLPELAASIRVMEKCGMRYIGEGNPEEGQRTVRYEIARRDFVAK